ncbi:MAG: DUF349 domain-containing protein [Bacteroidota bacterium]
MEKEQERVENEVMAAQEETVAEESRNMGEEMDGAATELEEAGKSIDYHSLSKKDFVDLLKETLKSNDFRKAEIVLKEAKHHFDELRNKEREEALQRFLAEGGKADDFDYRPQELDVAFDAHYKLLRDKRNQYFREQEEQKTANYYKKTELLERLRALVDADDTEHGFHAFKEIQKEWKQTGPVPNAHVKSLWANYTALVDRFYDHRSIYFELKELDRKKNLEAKLELCIRAEKLIDAERISEAVRELNELHNEFKHVGPVPQEEKEAVWLRFKAASDAVYKKRDEHLEKLNQELAANLEKKNQLAESIAAYGSFQTDRIKEWNQKTQELLAIQKQWESIGGVPRAKAKEVNKKFWTAFKSFFHNKSLFFKKLDEERTGNLKKKEEIVQQAEALKVSTDWDATAEALKQLQNQWKEIGPVPEKMREKIYQQFKGACDYFFEQRREQIDKVGEEQVQNLEKKEHVCAELEALAANGQAAPEPIKKLVERFNSIGFVPKKAMNASRVRFQKALDAAVAALPNMSENERERLRLELEMGNLRNDPQAERRIYQKEQHIRKKITQAENDLAVLRNNLEFFGRSKNATKLKDEFNVKIQQASDQLDSLKNQLKMLKTAS